MPASTELQLYGVVVGGVYPQQIVTASDSKSYADGLCAYLNTTVRNVCTVQKVDSFYPSHMTDCDKAWDDAANAYYLKTKRENP